MRKIFNLFILSLLVCSFVACSDDDCSSSKPRLVLSSDTITFQDQEIQKLLISLEGASETSYEILSYPDWVDVSPLSGFLLKKMQTIEITPKALASDTSGLYTGDLVIYSSLGTTNTVHLKRFVGECLIYNLPDSINIPIADSFSNLLIQNYGNVDMSYKISVSNDLISLSSNEGVVAVHKEENIKLNVNRDALDTGIYYTKLYIDINDKKDTIDVKIENLQEKKIILKSEIVAAEFSRVTNKIVYVSSDPLSLVIYDVDKKTSESIALKYVPTCLSISNDGKTAVVGHDGSVSYINLINKTVTSSIDVPFSTYDIVLGNNEWAYITSGGNNWDYVYSLDLKNKFLNSNSYSISGKSTIKLHPSGKYLYSFNTSSSYPFNKYDVQNGVANYMYDSSSSNNNYSISGGFDFSEDGKRMFIKNGVVLKVSEVSYQDLVYNGTIKGINYIEGIAHSLKKNNLYIINRVDGYYDSQSSDFISIYNAENLVFKKNIELEKYIVKNNGASNSYKSVPHFVFTNTAGNKVYVLSNCLESGLLYNWSLQELDIK